MKFNLAVLPGDGVGPEVTDEAVKMGGQEYFLIRQKVGSGEAETADVRVRDGRRLDLQADAGTWVQESLAQGLASRR